MSRYVIGIDLGTTNVAVAYLDQQAEVPEPQLFQIPQVSNSGEVGTADTLPSFLYLPNEGQFAQGSLDLPWATERSFCCGQHARKLGAMSPTQVVSSAKSWLCAGNVDRLADILPWDREESQLKISPVESAKRLLGHLRDAWNQTMDSEDRFEFQEIILTVPASFDAVARDLTVMAAEEAGLSVTLVEEPQAAFYAWLHEHGENWRDEIEAGQQILVCDIGGGTTDFSLIQVTNEDGNLGLERIAVGNHILLGGDNLDLALAYSVAAKLQRERNMKLDARQLAGLTHACREAKEELLRDGATEPQTLTVLGRGSSLIGGTISVQVTPEEAQGILLDGFFPACAVDAEPAQARRAGLRSFGLQYASDPAMTRHLAAFVSRNSGEDCASPAPPTE